MTTAQTLYNSVREHEFIDLTASCADIVKAFHRQRVFPDGALWNDILQVHVDRQLAYLESIGETMTGTD